MSNNFTDLVLWCCGISCASIVLLSPVACTIHQQKAIADAIKAGADPIAAKCALDSMTGFPQICMAYAVKQKQ